MAETQDTQTGKTTSRARGRPRAWTDRTDQNTIKSLDRAMEVLERLSEMNGATLSELAGALDQAPASVYRVLYTLEARGIVDFDSGAQVWHIGAGAFQIGSRFLRRTSLVERARPALRDLMQATGETANLGIARDGQVLFLSQVETQATIRAFFAPGTMSPMHASGIGKALLAQMGPERVAAILDRHGAERFTEHTLTGEALTADLAETRARGYAVDAEEKNLGMRCIAAPIFDVHGEAVAGISVSGPANRIPDDSIAATGGVVRDAAQAVTRGIGGRAPAA
ncbi:IclR family transcriptional regulator [Thalassococcus profundi]|uniref:IclR family transcriptional regulator n=1 Tax=Thalassococcus profundi TaxID=2282382 RepID=A0A369TQG2_9RHOB|nr:HTH-type transcriptional regulator BhcR [Thalassococcus profundi]RDD67493.1 IclR family transcriptional regulator [Thalassococcus profundi]